MTLLRAAFGLDNLQRFLLTFGIPDRGVVLPKEKNDSWVTFFLLKLLNTKQLCPRDYQNEGILSKSASVY